ncbi:MULTISPECIES: TetR/AcrR family transcriptional regulator [unclassified Streptomyces]|uniref:TetR/AcrR family transcriptional regulator n=1 Tax=unclassified Streptomyces TaxID=2593676 RepID=UPI002F915AC8
MTTGTRQARKGDTRQRIKDVALRLFVELGYEKASLRGIAEQLDVTKPALYHHFKTKEDILVSLFQDVDTEIDELIAWGQEQPRTVETKRELLSRYGAVLNRATPLFVFQQENQAVLRGLSVGRKSQNRLGTLSGLITDLDAPLPDRVRTLVALLALHFGTLNLPSLEGDPEEKFTELLDVAVQLLPASPAP